MSMHPSYGKSGKNATKRSVLKRYERIDELRRVGKWKDGEQKRVTNLPKTRTFQFSMKVFLENKQKDLKVYKRPLQLLVEVVLSLYDVKPDQVYICFVTAKSMREIHAEHFNDPTDTDCMSFPIDPEGLHTPHVLGEIIVCPKTALIYSENHKKDPYQELALYVVHGLLHCLGYDDIDPKDRKKMRQEEAHCMKEIEKHQIHLGIAPASCETP